MDIYPNTVEVAHWTLELDANLAAVTATVRLGGAERALTLAAATTVADGVWKRDATLTVRGASAAGAAVQVTAADARPLVTLTVPGGETVIRRSSLRFTVH